MSNYFQISFTYFGTTVPFPMDDDPETRQATSDFCAAEKKAMSVLTDLGVEHKHAYGFPDGSMFRYVRTNMSQDELREVLLQRLSDVEGLMLESIFVESPDNDPYKHRCNTLKEYMDLV